MLAWSVSILFAGLVVGGSIVTTIRAFPHYVMFFTRHLDLGLLLGLLMAIVFGGLGGDYGLSNLFWHERVPTQLLAGVSLAVLVLLVFFLGTLCNPRSTDDAWIVVVALRRRASRGSSTRIGRVIAGPLRVVPRFWQARRPRIASDRVRRYLVAMFLPVGLAPTLRVALAPFRLGEPPSLEHYAGAWALPLGSWLAFACAIAGLHAATRGLRIGAFRRRHGGMAVLLVASSVALAAVIKGGIGITAAMCICLLLGLVALFLFATYRRPILRIGLLIVAVVALGFTNNRDDKLKIPGMESSYRDPIDLSGVASVEINPNNPLAQIRQASTDIDELAHRPGGEARARIENKEAVEEVRDTAARVIERLEAARRSVCSARCHLGESEYDEARRDLNGMDEWLGLPNDEVRSAIADGKYSEADRLLEEFDEKKLKASLIKSYQVLFFVYRCRREYGNAETVLTSSLRLEPGDARVIADRGHARLLKGDRAGAIDDLDRALRIRPDDAIALADRGHLKRLMGDPEGAVADLDRALKLDPESDFVLAYRGDVRATRGDHAGAIADLDRALKINPENAYALERRGAARSARKDYAGAVADLDRALTIDPESVYFLASRGHARSVRGDRAGAIADLDRALKLAPENARALAYRGDVRASGGDYSGAIADFDHALGIDPENAYALACRGATRSARGDYARATDDLDKALKIDPANVYALGQRGHARASTEDFIGAIRDFNEALGVDPANVYALAHRGAARASRGDRAGAIDDLTKALKLGPDNAFALQKLRGLGVPVAPPVVQEPAPAKQGDPGKGSTSEVGPPRGGSGPDPAKGPSAIEKAEAPRAPSAPFVLETSYGLIKDRATLESWHASWKARGSERPKLVVVCASGGGMAAAYWTTLCLTELNLRDPCFPDRVRLVTGSSGGMLGASYYVAGLEKGRPRGPGELIRLRESLGETDFLTPVVRRLVLNDFWSIFSPWPVDHDRGQELERQWELATGGGDASRSPLALTFKQLAAGEKEGWRPSLILTPTLVEPGRRLIIGNLDLYDPAQGTLANSVQLFKLFPSEHRGPRTKKVIEALKLSTAVRLNASFPLITPVVPLPFRKPRLRAADAGYLDNYGVELAASWIERHLDWIKANTGGVALIQLQAYSPELEAELRSTASDEQQLLTRIARGWEFLTTPLETYTTARKAAMVYTNRGHVARLRKLFEKKTREGRGPSAAAGRFGFFESTELRCTAEAPLGWSLTRRDRTALEKSLAHDNADKIERLVEFLEQEAPRAGSGGREGAVEAGAGPPASGRVAP